MYYLIILLEMRLRLRKSLWLIECWLCVCQIIPIPFSAI